MDRKSPCPAILEPGFANLAEGQIGSLAVTPALVNQIRENGSKKENDDEDQIAGSFVGSCKLRPGAASQSVRENREASNRVDGAVATSPPGQCLACTQK